MIESFVEVSLDDDDFEDAQGRARIQKKDFKTKGVIWRVHLNDVDAFPSHPHAHCVEGMYAGHKLHLGAREVFDKTRATGMFLKRKQFERLCNEVSQHFPEFELPLPDE